MRVCRGENEKVRKCGTYNRHSSTSSKPGLTVTQRVWLTGLAENRRSDGKLRLIQINQTTKYFGL